jgi:hypothetical protein
MFGGFGPADLLEMDASDLLFWHRQAERIAKESAPDA